MRVKMSKQPPPAPTASAVGPCSTVIQIVGRPGTGSLPSTIAPPDHPLHFPKQVQQNQLNFHPQDFGLKPGMGWIGMEINSNPFHSSRKTCVKVLSHEGKLSSLNEITVIECV